MRKTFRVATKAVIYDSHKTKVLVIHMDQNDEYGLPGGHIEENETIDESIARELYEECGIENIFLRKVDFFTHADGKIVLAYIGIYNKPESIVSKQDNLEGIPVWLSKDEFQSINIESNYKKLVLQNWEKT